MLFTAIAAMLHRSLSRSRKASNRPETNSPLLRDCVYTRLSAAARNTQKNSMRNFFSVLFPRCRIQILNQLKN